MPAEQYTNDAFTALASAMSATDGTLVVQNVLGFPTIPQFRIRIDNELLLVTAVSGTTWTVTRAVEPCSGVQQAVAHASGSVVTEVLTAASLQTFSGSISIGEPVFGSTGDSLLGVLGNVVVNVGSYDGTHVVLGQGSGQGLTSIPGTTSAEHLTSITGFSTIDLLSGDAGSTFTYNNTIGLINTVTIANSGFAINASGPVKLASLAAIGSPAGIIIDDVAGDIGNTNSYANGQIPVAGGSQTVVADQRRGLYNGIGVPDPALGFVGDYYLDTAAGILYQKS